ncbi:MAG: substrate-binding domain-containing protein [Anaerolineae bacterium]|nr:substrate-binding domain-containing protein [Anaerolineae bacterium]
MEPLKKIFPFMCAAILASCGPSAAALPTTRAISLTIAFTPAVQPIIPALQTCASFQEQVHLNLVETPSQALDLTTSDLAFHLGEPAELPKFAAPLVWDRIVVVLHPDNPVKQLSHGQVRDLISGRARQWGKGAVSEVQPWVPTAESDYRAAFQQAVMAGSLESPAALLAPNPAGMLRAVAADPNAIGYLPRAWVTDEVKVIDLNVPILVLALAAEEPEGPARILLACLQSAIGQAALSDHYMLLADE